MNSLSSILITPGSAADYRALAHFHYRPGRPAIPSLYLRAAPNHNPRETVGVLVVSRPTILSRTRALAFPRLFSNHHPDLARINALVRLISRVIIDPRYRGVGLAHALVREYLRHPLTPITEAVAAMGAVCPFFAAAGMTPYPLGPTPRDDRLIDALAHIRRTPEDLARANSPLDLSPRRAHRALIARELRRWASESPSFRPRLTRPSRVSSRPRHDADPRDDFAALARAAAGALLCPPVGYVYVTPGTPLLAPTPPEPRLAPNPRQTPKNTPKQPETVRQHAPEPPEPQEIDHAANRNTPAEPRNNGANRAPM